MNNTIFENWYKNKIQESKETPPEGIWENISNELDIHAIWNKVNGKLNYVEARKRRNRGFVFVLSLITIFSITFFVFVKRSNRPVNGVSVIVSKKKPSSRTDKGVADEIKNFLPDNNNNLSLTKHFLGKHGIPFNHNGIISQNVSSQTILKKNLIAAEKNSFIESSDSQAETKQPDNIPLQEIKKDILNECNGCNYRLIIPELPILFNVSAYRFPIEDTKQSWNGFFAGAIFAWQNSWLLNRTTFEGLSKNSLNETVPNLGVAYGVSVAHYFPSQWSLHTDWLLESHYGQTYNVYNEGSYIIQKINLCYQQINLYAVKRKDPQPLFRDIATSKGPLFGFNMKYLSYAKESSNKINNDVASTYSKFDYGLLLGYEYDLLIKKKLMIASSVMGDLGFNNIYSGNNSEPKAFDRTVNASIRLGLAVRWSIR